MPYSLEFPLDARALARRLRTSFVATLLLSLFLAAMPAPAQEPPAQDAEAGDEAAAGDEEIEALIRILEDDAARARLVERLRAEAAEEQVPFRRDADETLAARLAEYTREAAEGTAELLANLSALVDQLAALTNGALEIDFGRLERVLLDVAVLVAATFAVFVVLRLAFRALQRRVASAAAIGDLVTRIKMTAASVVLDAGTVVVAWAAGYAMALWIGDARQIGLNESLFLNAFVIVELLKAGSRAVLAPRWTALRPFPMDDTTAAYWYFWLSRLLSLVGYTFLFIAPLLAAGVSSDAASIVRIIVMFTALVIAVAVILQNRDSIRAQLTRRAASGRGDPLSRVLATVGRIWHIVAIVYLVAIFGLWLLHPDTALPFVLSATWKSVVAILLGAIVAGFIGRIISGGMRLPEDVKARLPLLEARLNAFVPSVLRVVRLVVGIAVAVTIIDVWNIADVSAWLASERGQGVIASLVSAALILLAGCVVYLAVESWIEYRLNPNLGHFISARERTLLGLFRNAFTVVLSVLVFMLVLSQIGVNIAPLLAGVGVVGLAVGFGAQKLVQDVINGAFIQFENSLNEGDVVEVGGISGVVERLTIRSVSLRSLDGTYHVIPFSAVDTVSNLMKHFSYHIASIGVTYRESIPDVKDAMLEAFGRLKETAHAADILGDFDMHGVTEFGSYAIVVRGRIKTLPGKQWAVGRAYNELVKTVFDERGIELPISQMKLHLAEDRGGIPALTRQSGGPGGDAPAAGDGGARLRSAEGSTGGSRAGDADAGGDADADAPPAAPRSSRG